MRKVSFAIVLALALGTLFMWKTFIKKEIQPSKEAVPLPVKSSSTAQDARPFPETFVPEADLPMMLPTSEAMVENLVKEFGSDNFKFRTSFFLGINAQLNRCAGGKVPKSRFLFWVKWRPAEDGTAMVVSSVEEIGPENPGAIDEGGLSPEQKKMILDCAREYAATARWPLDTRLVPEQAQDEEEEALLAIPARFPVTDNKIYSLLSKSNPTAL